MINKRLLFVLITFSLLFIGNACADDVDQTAYGEMNNNVVLLQNNIYVDGIAGNSGDGSISNPLSNIKDAVDLAEDNSTIHVKGGIYSASSNSQININKNLTIESYDGVATITGEYNNYIFNISSSSSLTLKNIKFSSTTHASTQTHAAILNYGNLKIEDSIFENSSAVRTGVVLNYGNLTVANSLFSQNKGHYYGGAISNFGYATIENSTFSNNQAQKASGILNSNYMIIKNSTFIDNDLDSEEYYSSASILIVDKSYFFGNSTVNANKTSIKISQSYIGNLSTVNSNVVASYCFISYYDFVDSQLEINDNLWCSNQKVPNEATSWIVMLFTDINGNTVIPSNTPTRVLVSFKIYDGRSYRDLGNNVRLPERINLTFEADNGKFSTKQATIKNNVVENNYSGNTKSTILNVYLDGYIASLKVGTGYDNDEIYVSNDGNDNNDGSRSNPFKTLSKAISVATNGNTIYILPGSYYGIENSNLLINKSLTIKGIGKVTIYRANANLFTVAKNGVLNLENLILTAEDPSKYYLILNNTGNANIINCTFKNLNGGDKYYYKQPNYRYYSNQSIIYTTNNLNIFNSTFIDLKNFVIRSPFDLTSSYFKNFNVTIKDSLFKNCEGMKWDTTYDTYENFVWNKEYNDEIYPSFIIHVAADNILIDGCEFIDNSASDLHFKSVNQAIINNCLFENNHGIAYSVDGGILINNSIISDNEGPSLHFVTGHTLSLLRGVNTLVNTQFIRNNGVILNTWYHYRDTIYMYNCSFINNTNSHSQGYGNTSSLGLIQNGGDIIADYCVFENNSVYYGGVFYNDQFDSYGYSTTLTVTNSIFYNNNAVFGKDIFQRGGIVYTENCWWGSNRGPFDNNIFQDTGELIIKNWAILSLELIDNELIASLNKVTDSQGNVYNSTGILPSRTAKFDSDSLYINPNVVSIINNTANVFVYLDGSDVSANVTVDGQTIDLVFYNRNTIFELRNATFYGVGNILTIILKSVNGYAIINQTVLIEILDESGIVYNVTLTTDEKGVINVPIMVPKGNYTIRAIYKGDNYFKPALSSVRLEVLPFITVLNMKGEQIFWGNMNMLYAHLYNNFGEAVINQTVKFVVTGKNNQTYIFYATTDINGRASVYLNIPEGVYTVKAIFEGDDWHYGSESNGHFSIASIGTNIVIEQSQFYGRGNILTILLNDNNFRPIYNATVYITLSRAGMSQTFEVKTDSEGRAGLIVNLEPGVYDVFVEFKGDSLDHSSNAHKTLTILKVQTQQFADSVVIINNETQYFEVKLTDIYGRPLAGETIEITVISQSTGVKRVYRVVTDENGIARLDTVLPVGNYLVKTYLNESAWYSSSNYASTMMIRENSYNFDPYGTILSAEDFSKYYNDGTKYIITLTDIYGNPLANREIGITINGVTYHRITDNEGKVKFSINLAPGVYKIDVFYNSTDRYGSSFANSTVEVLSQIKSSDVMIVYKSDSRYVIRFVDIDGKPIAGQDVTFTINNVNYHRVTDEFGEASLKINLEEGLYNITTSCNGFVNHNIIWVAIPVICEDLLMYYNDGSKFAAKIVDENGIPVVNESVKFTINGKTYVRTTNSEGFVYLGINLNNGLYSIITEYNGYIKRNNIYVYNTPVYMEPINQEDSNNTYAVRLVDYNGNIIRNAKVQFRVNGKTYECISDEEGYAKLNIDLKKGVYKIITSFNCYNYEDKINYGVLTVN